MGNPVDMDSTNNWQGFCRAYAKEFNITYAAAISQAGPAWREYKKEKGLKFKSDLSPSTSSTTALPPSKGDRVKKLKKQKVSGAAYAPPPPGQPLTGKDYVLQHHQEMKKEANRKEGKRPREEASELPAPKSKGPQKKAANSTKPPAKRARKTAPPPSTVPDYSIYATTPTPPPTYHPYPCYPSPYAQWGAPPPPVGWGAPPPTSAPRARAPRPSRAKAKDSQPIELSPPNSEMETDE